MGESETRDAEDAGELARAQAEEDRWAREEALAVGPMVAMALIPLGLVLTALSALLGPLVWKAWPALFMLTVVGLAVHRMMSVRLASDRPLDLGRHGRFEGEEKRRLLRRGAVILALVCTAWLAWELVYEAQAMGALRRWVMGWRI